MKCGCCLVVVVDKQNRCVVAVFNPPLVDVIYERTDWHLLLWMDDTYCVWYFVVERSDVAMGNR